MDDATIHYLNDLNRRFYEITAADFDASRQQPWEGWFAVQKWFGNGSESGVFTVLDIGCGNGRFGLFLAEHLGKSRLRYLGLDSSPVLLERARTALASLDFRLELRDILTQPPDTSLGHFDLVVLFGVLHHVPGADRRLALMRSLADRVAPGGLLVFTEWRFLENPRLVERIVPWDAGIQVEPGDYLLDWRRGERALRYCHAVDDAEHARLVAATALTPVDEFRADAANLYTVLRKQS